MFLWGSWKGGTSKIWTRIGAMNRSESPSTALRAPSPPLGEKDGMRGCGSWEASTIPESRIGTMNPIVLVLVLVLVLETKLAGRGRVRERGRGRRDGSWKGIAKEGDGSHPIRSASLRRRLRITSRSRAERLRDTWREFCPRWARAARTPRRARKPARGGAN